MLFEKISNGFLKELSGIDRASCSCQSCPCNRSARTGDTASGASGGQNSGTKGSRVNNSGSAC